MQYTPAQVYQQTLAEGGSTAQAQVAAALVDGVESNGDPTELAGGVGPAQGLFQFEPGTWLGGAGGGRNGLPSTVGAASWTQQIQGFINDTGGPGGDNFSAWGPDLVANSGDPNSVSNPAYGYTGAPQAGSRVANAIASLNLGAGSNTAVPANGTTSGQTGASTATLDSSTGIPILSIPLLGTVTIPTGLISRAAIGLFGIVLLYMALKSMFTDNDATDVVVTPVAQTASKAAGAAKDGAKKGAKAGGEAAMGAVAA